MFANKDDNVIQENNKKAEEESSVSTPVEESKVKKVLTVTADTLGFASGLIIAVTGATLVFQLTLATTGLSICMALLAFLAFNLICILCSYKLKTDNWIPQMGGLHV